MKGTGIFGGVQVFQILVSLLRGKFVAMFLGPAGIGVSSLFGSSTDTLVRLSSLGLNLAVVKDVAETGDDSAKRKRVVEVSLQMFRCTALLGALLCALLSPWLSRLSFGSDEYTWQFLALSVMVYLTVSGGGKVSLLQGLQQRKILAFTSLVGACSGLLFGVPLYYFFGTKGIVPAMILLSMATYTAYTVGIRRALSDESDKSDRSDKSDKSDRWGLKRGINIGYLRENGELVKRILMMGLILMSSAVINTACVYGINIFIRTFGDLADVGLYNAANSLTNQYSRVVFTAMSLDYFPRLAAVAGDREAMRELVDKQLDIVSMLIAPAIVLFIAIAPLVVMLLLTDQFMGVTPLLRWMGLGVMLKALSYPLGYIAFAKNNRKLFFWMEAVGANLLMIGMALLFYHLYGLIGMGYAVVAENGLCILMYLVVNYKAYRYLPTQGAWMQIGVALLFGVATFLCSMIANGAVGYPLMGLLFVIAAGRSWKQIKVKIKGEPEE